MVHKIRKAKKQDHLGNHRAMRKVTGKLVTTSWITEYIEYLFLQSSRRIQYATKKVKSLIEKFENHKHKESFIQDLSQTQKINTFSKKSQELIADLNNTEIFELCENSSKQQCPDCNLYWEKGIIHCSCGRTMKSTRNPTEFDQNNRDVASIPGHVIKKSSSRGVNTVLVKDKNMYYQATDAKKGPTRKTRTPSNDTLTLVCRRRLQKVTASHGVGRTPHNVVRQNRLGEAHLRRNKS